MKDGVIMPVPLSTFASLKTCLKLSKKLASKLWMKNRMATRIFCDHCGNTISGKNPNRFSFGPYQYSTMNTLSNYPAGLGNVGNQYGQYGLINAAQQAVPM